MKTGFASQLCKILKNPVGDASSFSLEPVFLLQPLKTDQLLSLYRKPLWANATAGGGTSFNLWH